jgi:K(+)-stimulated pyrophosphate-energized sodium pump
MWVAKQDPGNERMQLIGKWIVEGVMVFLSRDDRSLAVFIVAVAVILGVAKQVSAEDTDWTIAVSFVFGAVCSALRATSA